MTSPSLERAGRVEPVEPVEPAESLEKAARPARRPYRAPKVRHLGCVRDLTLGAELRRCRRRRHVHPADVIAARCERSAEPSRPLDTTIEGSGPAEATSLGYRIGRAPLPYVVVERSREPSAAGGLLVERGGFGGRPAYVRRTDGAVLVSTDLSWMVDTSRARGWDVSIDPDRIASECLFDAGPVGRTQTLLREIQEIPPATRVHLLPDGMTLEALAPPRVVQTNEGERVERLRALLGAAMARAVEGAQQVGVLTGGGLDSGALLAMAHARVPRTTALIEKQAAAPGAKRVGEFFSGSTEISDWTAASSPVSATGSSARASRTR